MFIYNAVCTLESGTTVPAVSQELPELFGIFRGELCQVVLHVTQIRCEDLYALAQ